MSVTFSTPCSPNTMCTTKRAVISMPVVLIAAGFFSFPMNFLLGELTKDTSPNLPPLSVIRPHLTFQNLPASFKIVLISEGSWDMWLKVGVIV